MTPATAIAERLLSLTAVTDLVGQRVRVLRLDQSELYPAIRVQEMVPNESGHLRGSVGVFRSRVQVDVFANAASGADPYALAAEIVAAVHGNGAGSGLAFYAGIVGGSPAFQIDVIEPAGGAMPQFDPDELQLVRMSRDYMVTWRN